MYTFVLAVHNIMRWIVVVLAIIALVRAYWGWFGKREWSLKDRKVGMFYSISLDVQLLLGLILYFGLSPMTRTAIQNLGAAMSNANLRFFALEHFFFMLVAAVLVHAGTITSRKAEESVTKHRRAAIWFTLAVIAILLGMPWSRPLIPLF
jgi:uncharacterized membrane protein YphA (DoxX/SURF4 family)